MDEKLGKGYSEDEIRAVLAGKKEHIPRKKAAVQSEPLKVNLLVDIQAKLQAGKGAGYARWAKVFNLKQMAQTMNYLTEHGLLEYAVFPDVFKPLASNMSKALTELRERKDVKWTYISPAGDFQAEGERTGKYLTGGEELILNGLGESIISYADYAIAMVDEAVNGEHIQQRISVVRT